MDAVNNGDDTVPPSRGRTEDVPTLDTGGASLFGILESVAGSSGGSVDRDSLQPPAGAEVRAASDSETEGLPRIDPDDGAFSVDIAETVVAESTISSSTIQTEDIPHLDPDDGPSSLYIAARVVAERNATASSKLECTVCHIDTALAKLDKIVPSIHVILRSSSQSRFRSRLRKMDSSPVPGSNFRTVCSQDASFILRGVSAHSRSLRRPSLISERYRNDQV